MQNMPVAVEPTLSPMAMVDRRRANSKRAADGADAGGSNALISAAGAATGNDRVPANAAMTAAWRKIIFPPAPPWGAAELNQIGDHAQPAAGRAS